MIQQDPGVCLQGASGHLHIVEISKGRLLDDQHMVSLYGLGPDCVATMPKIAGWQHRHCSEAC